MIPVRFRPQSRSRREPLLEALALLIGGVFGLLAGETHAQRIAAIAVPAIVIAARRVARHDRRAYAVALPGAALLAAALVLDLHRDLATLIHSVNARSTYDRLTVGLAATTAIACAALAFAVRRDGQARCHTAGNMLFAAVAGATSVFAAVGLVQVNLLVIAATGTGLILLREREEGPTSGIFIVAASLCSAAVVLARLRASLDTSTSGWRLTDGWLTDVDLMATLMTALIAAHVLKVVAALERAAHSGRAIATGAVLGLGAARAYLDLVGWLDDGSIDDVMSLQVYGIAICAGALVGGTGISVRGVEAGSLKLFAALVGLAGMLLAVDGSLGGEAGLRASGPGGLLAFVPVAFAVLVIWRLSARDTAASRRELDLRELARAGNLLPARAVKPLRAGAAGLVLVLAAVVTPTARQPYLGEVLFERLDRLVPTASTACLTNRFGALDAGAKVQLTGIDADGRLALRVGSLAFTAPLTAIRPCGTRAATFHTQGLRPFVALGDDEPFVTGRRYILTPEMRLPVIAYVRTLDGKYEQDAVIVAIPGWGPMLTALRPPRHVA